MNLRTYQDILPRFEDMLEFVRDARKFVIERHFEAFIKDKAARYALERVLELLGEAAGRVPSSVREEFPSIPWRDMIGQRNVLAHDYGQIKHELLYRTAVDKLPALEVLLVDAVTVLKAKGTSPLSTQAPDRDS